MDETSNAGSQLYVKMRQNELWKIQNGGNRHFHAHYYKISNSDHDTSTDIRDIIGLSVNTERLVLVLGLADTQLFDSALN